MVRRLVEILKAKFELLFAWKFENFGSDDDLRGTMRETVPGGSSPREGVSRYDGRPLERESSI